MKLSPFRFDAPAILLATKEPQRQRKFLLHSGVILQVTKFHWKFGTGCG
jgi:hypothetical protein